MIDIGKAPARALTVEASDEVGLAAKACRILVGLAQRFPMAARPVVIGCFHFVDPGQVMPLCTERDGQPMKAMGSLDAVAIAPVAAGILHFVEKDEFVAAANEVEITFPGNVRRLDDSDSLTH